MREYFPLLYADFVHKRHKSDPTVKNGGPFLVDVFVNLGLCWNITYAKDEGRL